MDIKFLSLLSALEASIDVIDSILSSETLLKPSIRPSKSTKKPSILKKRKRTLFEILIEILYIKDVKFDSLYVSYVLV